MASTWNDDGRLSRAAESVFSGDDPENSGRHSTYSKQSTCAMFARTDEGRGFWIPHGTLGAQDIGPWEGRWPMEVAFGFSTDEDKRFRLVLRAGDSDAFGSLLKRLAEGKQWLLLPKSDGIESIFCEPL